MIMIKKVVDEIGDIQLRDLCEDLLEDLDKWPHVELEEMKAFGGYKCWVVGYVSGFSKGRKKRKFVAIGIKAKEFVYELESHPKPIYKAVGTKKDLDDAEESIKFKYDDLVEKL